ncbi:hypothetical protein BX600DRAFT_481901 [Xylariales sp. PMI_506]|nr:hypothetical protein BX600DRAFT_481901 [Xylariales sp. PMI_506]
MSSSRRALPDIIVTAGSKQHSSVLDPVVQGLKDVIESRADLHKWASSMFEEIPNQVPYNKALVKQGQARGYIHMLQLLSVISMVDDGPAILDCSMGTSSGHAFFLSNEVNERFKVILDTWRHRVMKTSRSQCSYAFYDLFKCDSKGNPIYRGFKSGNDSFARWFRDIDKLRPVALPNSPEWVVIACECEPLRVKSNLKCQNDSIAKMLHHHKSTDQFVGGAVYQAMLNLTSYHRRASPVSGHVVHAKVANGAYFSERSPVGSPKYSLLYISHVATQAIIFIRAPEPVGKFTANWPQPLEKGEEIGVFHYGGSSLCLLFRRGGGGGG